MTTDTVIVLGRDSIGTVAEAHGMRYYLTDCCGASAKGCDGYIGCRACYNEVDPVLGDVPDKATVLVRGTRGDKPGGAICYDDLVGGWWTFADRPVAFVEVYGDGVPYDQWKANR